MSARHRYVAAGLATLALTVSACSGGGGDPVQTSSSPTSSSSSTTSAATSPSSDPSSSATASIDPADLPADARKHTPEGAAAFVKYYFEQVNLAWTTPDAGLLPALAEAGCKSCAGLQETAQSLVAKQHKYAAPPITVTKVKAFDGAPERQQFVRVFIEQHEVSVVDQSGNVVDKDKAGQGARTASVLWVGESWQVYGIA